MSQRVTLQTIADLAGVSRITVSNAFSRPDQLSAGLRQRVLAIADELGYAGPHAAARILSRGKSDTIGVLFTDQLSYAFADPVATTFLAGLAEVLEAQDLGLTVLSSPRGGSAGPVLAAVMDGLVVYSVDSDSEGLRAARRRGLPMVFVDQEPEADISSVVIEDRRGAHEAAEHVARLGHHRVALVLGGFGDRTRILEEVPTQPPSHHVLRARLAGWQEGLGLLATKMIVNIPRHDREHGARAAELLLALPEPPTAVLCLSDEVARGVLETAHRVGVAVPEQLSVVGFDDAPGQSTVGPALTTVAQPVHEKGVRAARLLLEQLNQPTDLLVRPQTIRLPTRLVVRDSTGPPPTRR